MAGNNGLTATAWLFRNGYEAEKSVAQQGRHERISAKTVCGQNHFVAIDLTKRQLTIRKK